MKLRSSTKCFCALFSILFVNANAAESEDNSDMLGSRCGERHTVAQINNSGDQQKNDEEDGWIFNTAQSDSIKTDTVKISQLDFRKNNSTEYQEDDDKSPKDLYSPMPSIDKFDATEEEESSSSEDKKDDNKSPKNLYSLMPSIDKFDATEEEESSSSDDEQKRLSKRHKLVKPYAWRAAGEFNYDSNKKHGSAWKKITKKSAGRNLQTPKKSISLDEKNFGGEKDEKKIDPRRTLSDSSECVLTQQTLNSNSMDGSDEKPEIKNKKSISRKKKKLHKSPARALSKRNVKESLSQIVRKKINRK